MIDKVYIYTLEDPDTGAVRYVGKTMNLDGRFKGHLKSNKRTKKCAWVRSLLKSGRKPVIQPIEVLENCTDEDWQEVERFWIQTLKFYGCDLTNLDSGGIGGKRMSIETKEKLRVFNTGRKFTEDERRACSEAHKGIRLSDAAKLKLSKYVRTEEYKMKMSSVKTGKALPAGTGEKISQSLRRIKNERSLLFKAAHARRTAEEKSETGAKISAALRGRTLTDEHKAKLSLAKMGKKLSLEHALKNAEGHRGLKYKTKLANCRFNLEGAH